MQTVTQNAVNKRANAICPPSGRLRLRPYFTTAIAPLRSKVLQQSSSLVKLPVEIVLVANLASRKMRALLTPVAVPTSTSLRSSSPSLAIISGGRHRVVAPVSTRTLSRAIERSPQK